MILAQLTDLHVTVPASPFDARYGTADSLARAVAHVSALEPRPDAVVCTGDLVNDGRPDEYARLFAILRQLPMPWFVLPGNHDGREALRAALRGRPEIPDTGRLSYAVDLGALRLIALDTLVEGKPGGRVGEDQLAWLEARLSEAPSRPTVIAMHHPPFATGIEAMDGMGLEDGAALERIVARHPNVERILCGHLHRAITRRFGGTLASTCPSTGPQVALDLRPDVPARLLVEPTACQLHLWSEQLGLVTHTSYIEAGK